MREFRTVAALRGALREVRRAGHRVAFVPTMGALHDGHLALVDRARAAGDVVVMSIFVNPLQFGPGEDLARYPRDETGDLRKARERGADIVFLPAAEEMYPAGREVTVLPGAASQKWEGAVRPGHFAGVLTVVAKLFNIVQPDVAVFGQKDLQQVAVVRAMIRDLDYPIELVVPPTVRESDGLAMSSRNAFLQGEDRRRALALSAALRTVRGAFDRGERGVAALVAAGEEVLRRGGLTADYLAIVDADTMRPMDGARPGHAAIVAARVGTPRLIDNTILGVADPGLDR